MAGKINLCFILRCNIGADIRHADNKLPFSREDRSGQIRRRGIRLAYSKCALVAAAPSAKTSRIEEAEIECRVLLAAGVMKCNCDGYNPWRNIERGQNIRVVLPAGYAAVQNDVWLCHGLCVQDCSKKNEEQKSGESRAFHHG